MLASTYYRTYDKDPLVARVHAMLARAQRA
jgi:hypothetical protein